MSYYTERYKNDAEFREYRKNRDKYKSGAWKSWKSMRGRVLCEKATGHEYYKDFLIDPRWEKFCNFYADMGDRPENMTLDRRDNSKGYCKDNCRWVTPAEQARNRRTTKLSKKMVGEIRKVINIVPRITLASKYKVSLKTISAIAGNRTWKGVPANV